MASNRKNLAVLENEVVEFPTTRREVCVTYNDPNRIVKKYEAIFERYKKIFYVAEYKARAAVLIVNADKEVLFVKQYRFLADRLTLELPAGACNRDESLKHAAIRECIEEAGVKCKNLIKLTSFVPDYEYTDNPTTIFLCKEFDFHNTELPITWLNMAQAKDLIRLGEINDSLTLIALYSLWERWRSKI